MGEGLDKAAEVLVELGIGGQMFEEWLRVISFGLKGTGTLGRDGYDMLAAYADEVEDDWVGVWLMLFKDLEERSISLHVSEVLRRALAAARGEAHED